MKHKIQDAVEVNINLEVPTQDLEGLIDKVTESALTIVVAVTIGGILKSIFRR